MLRLLHGTAGTTSTAPFIAKPLVDGLAYAHLKLLEHRDIKPSNILIDASGAPLLADFGIAKIRAQRSKTAGAWLRRLGGHGLLGPGQAVRTPPAVPRLGGGH